MCFLELDSTVTIIMLKTKIFRNKVVVYLIFLSTLRYTTGLANAETGVFESDGNHD